MPEQTAQPAGLGAPLSNVPRGAALRSVAAVLPETVVHNDAIAERIGKSDDWIYTRTGIRERRVARDDERLSDFAAAAGRLALERAGLTGAELDLVLVATMTQDEVTPNAAPLVAHALGAQRAGAVDIGAACTSFLSAVALAAAQIETGRADRVLVIGADFISRITDHDSKATAMLFADGAGAVVVTAADPPTPTSSARSGRSCCAPTARSRRSSTRRTSRERCRWTATRPSSTPSTGCPR